VLRDVSASADSIAWEPGIGKCPGENGERLAVNGRQKGSQNSSRRLA
jgi:hypothetical protein